MDKKKWKENVITGTLEQEMFILLSAVILFVQFAFYHRTCIILSPTFWHTHNDKPFVVVLRRFAIRLLSLYSFNDIVMNWFTKAFKIHIFKMVLKQHNLTVEC